jgi:hypothetical protein
VGEWCGSEVYSCTNALSDGEGPATVEEHVVKVRLHDKLRALEMIAKLKGWT